MGRLKNAFLDWYSQAEPPSALRLLSVPLDHLAKRDWSTHESARMVSTACSFAAHHQLAGDYFEFGVYRGATFVQAWDAARRNGLVGMRFHAFDGFTGLPQPSGLDTDSGFSAGQYRASRSEFEARLRSHRVDPRRVTVTEGMFDRSLTEERKAALGVERAAIVWIDSDLYESTVPVLEWITGLLQHGTVLCFDDWFCHRGDPMRGEQRACREWLEAQPHISLMPYREFHWAGESFIVHLRDGALGR